jgi:hypothetical protein
MEIPEITDEKIELLLQKIHPLVLQDGRLMRIEPVHPRDVAFTWDPVVTEPATNVEELVKIRTLHTYGYYGFFKPSIAEVLAQIPEEWLERTIAFSTQGPNDAAEMNLEKKALDAGFHVAETTLYGLSS